MSFNGAVLAWLQTEAGYPDAAQVVSISGRGTDWAGSTEDGYYDTFSANIDWLDRQGGKHYDEIAGDRMEKLWDWVMKEWPA